MNINHMHRQFAVASASLLVFSGMVVFNPRPVEARGTRQIVRITKEWAKKCAKSGECWMVLNELRSVFEVSDEQQDNEPSSSGKGFLTRTGGGEERLISKRVVRVIKRVPISQ